jgi:predicted RNA binding protein YcfA (HicA-like mRNA interferase family)
MASWEKDVIKKLREHGCTFDRHGKGDHDVWYSPLTKRKFIVDGKILSRHTANGIMKQAGITHRF